MPTSIQVSTLVDLLRSRARLQPEKGAYVFLQDGEEETARLTYGELDERARAVAARLQEAEGARPGDRALLLFPPGLEFLEAFFGCLYAGVVAVPSYPPRPGREQPRLRSIVEDSRPRFALTTAAIAAKAPVFAEAEPDFAEMRWIVTEEIPSGPATQWREPEISGETLAFLQYTSGSTADPKGVEVSHGNLLFMEDLIRRAFQQDESSVVVGWLPVYHDMGLIGNVLQPLHLGSTCVLMSPVAFLRRPRRWLEAISRYRGTTSGGPNFAYELCVDRIPESERAGLDLSSWRVAFNGAEPVRASTLERFAAAFAPHGFRREAFLPCYGLAEATLLVSGAVLTRGPEVLAVEKGRELVSSGPVPEGMRVEVVDPASLEPVGPGREGELWVAAGPGMPGIPRGYWNRPEVNREVFQARTADGDGPYLRTGDLGFLRGGELYVTGRLKDLIILRGRNHYPQDLELTAEQSAPGLATAGGAAFSVEVDGEERLVVAQEVVPRLRPTPEQVEELAGAIRRAVAEGHEMQAWDVVVLRPGALPKTSSGKVQRQLCRRMYLEGALESYGHSQLAEVAVSPGGSGDDLDHEALLALAPEDRAEALESWLRDLAARVLRVPAAELRGDRPLIELGLDSLAAIELGHAVESALGVELPVAVVLEGASLRDLAEPLTPWPPLPSPPLPPGEGGRFRTDVNVGRGLNAAAWGATLPAINATVSAASPLSRGQGGRWERGPGGEGLSAGQRGLWFLHRLTPGDTAYHLTAAARLHGGVSAATLRTAFQALADRHDALRTTYPQGPDGEPVARIHPSLPVAFAEHGPEAAIEDAVFRPFDLQNGPILRVDLFDRPGGRVLALSIHHIAADFWSFGVLGRELAVLLEGAALEEAPRYIEVVRRQEERLAGEAGERLWSYWRERLDGVPALELPFSWTPPAPGEPMAPKPTSCRRFDFGPELTTRLKRMAAEKRATLPALVLAGLQTVLHRYSGQSDFAVGMPVVGRPSGVPGAREAVGYFVNPVVLRADLAGSPPFAALLEQARARLLEALAHAELPYPLLAERLRARREDAGLFNVLLAWHRPVLDLDGLVRFALGEEGGRVHLGPLELESVALPLRSAQFDLNLHMGERDGSIGAALVYDPHLLDEAEADRLLGHLAILLAGAVEDAARPVSALPLLTPAERGQIQGWNATAVAFPRTSIPELFAAQADRTPDAPAVTFEGKTLTYARLDEAANRLANRLRRLGVGTDSTVGVALERSLELIVALLATLKAGGAYLPLELSYPDERLHLLLADTGAPVVLTLGEHRRRFARDRVVVIALDEDREELRREDPRRPDVAILPESGAYVLYTSGSTGLPKGVVNTHAGIANRLLWGQGAFPLDANDSVLQKTPYTFDVSVWELFWPLVTGARLVVARPGGHREPAYLLRVMAEERITTCHFVPSLLQVFLEEPGLEQAGSLRRVITSGEALPADLARRFFARLPGVELHNLYGPTEAAVEVTAWACRPGEDEAGVPIGRPIANLEIQIVDRAGNLMPPGLPGELWIGGTGLARGYLRRPDLTAERFVPHPEPPVPGARLYRTGDRARFRPDGALEYLGRIDLQVKIRGVRIEPGEVEAVLALHPGIREAAVLPLPDLSGLAAYFVAAAGADPSPADLREHLRARLPEAYVPAAWVRLDALPLNLSGKVDRKALARIEVAVDSAAASAAPRGPVEELLAALWAELLGSETGRIGRDDGFFELGGHSLLAVRVLARVREAFGVELPLAVLFEASTPAALARRIEDVLRGRRGDSGPIPRVRRDQPLPAIPAIPATFFQERLAFLDRLQPGKAAYNIPLALDLRGPLDVPALSRALDGIVERHEALRTTLGLDGDLPVQIVHAPAPVDPEVCEVEPGDVEWRSREEAARPFDLEGGPLLRAVLLRRGAEDHRLLVTVHHAVADGGSLEILLDELAALYAGRSLPELPVQLADFAAWERAAGEQGRREAQLATWGLRLAGAPALELPADRPRPPVQSLRGGSRTAVLDAANATRIARRERTTPFLVLLAAFESLLYRITGQADLVVGTPVSQRSRVELEPLIGPLVNTLVLRVAVDPERAFRDLLARVREVTLEAVRDSDLPFELLVDRLRPERSLSYNPLFQVTFAYQPARTVRALAGGLTAEAGGVETGTAKFDLGLSLVQDGDRLAATLEYSADLFDETTAARLLRGFEMLLGSLDAHLPVAHLPLLPAAERQQVLVEWNATEEGGAFVPVHEQVARQAAATPDGLAVVSEAGSLTYAELHGRAGRLARHLVDLGLEPEGLVGVLAERSVEKIVGILAVLQAGGAYVPLDPAWPQERLAFVLADARIGILLAQPRWMMDLPRPLPLEVVGLDLSAVLTARDQPSISAHPSASVVGARFIAPTTARAETRTPPSGLTDAGAMNCAPTTDADSPCQKPGVESARGSLPENRLAYVIYTSGSTGTPKGVALHHRGLANLIAWHRGAYHLSAADRATQLASPAFDASVWEIWPYLTVGASLHIPPEETRLSPSLLARWIGDQSITLAFLPTPLAEALLGQPWPASSSLRALLTGGDRLHRRSLPEHPFLLVNHYGPTEGTVVATAAVVHPEPEDRPPSIGRPIANVHAYVLDRGFEPVPLGVPGELALGGVGLGRGYLHRPDLTAESFRPDPFGGEPGARLYRTGDLVRLRPDGRIDFLRRIDQQVKIKGFRIELGEIEAVLRDHAGVWDAAVLAREDHPGEPRLVAYVAPRDAAPKTSDLPADLRSFLRARLPEFMVPAAFVLLDTLPLNPSGKVDRLALARLASPDPGEPSGADFVAPRDPVEETVAAIFAEVLAVERVGAHDSFFDLGGHSLVATQAVSRLRAALGVELPLRVLFEAPTPAALAEIVRRELGEGKAPAAPPLLPAPAAERERPAPLSYAQSRLWLLDRLDPGRATYNLPVAIRLRGHLDAAVLEAALGEVVRRHDALRTTFRPGPEPVQIVTPPGSFVLPLVDLSALGKGAEAQARVLAEEDARRPFDLERGPVIRPLLLRISDRDHVLAVTMHHIVSDGWSTGVLLREVGALYAAFGAGRPAHLSPLPVQYADFARWQRSWLAGDVLAAEIEPWRRRLSGMPPFLELPTDRPRPAVQTSAGGHRPFALSLEATRALRTLSKEAGATLFMAVAAGFQAWLGRLSGQRDFGIGTPAAGRSRAEIEGLIGFFVNTLVLRADLGEDPSFRELLGRVRAATLESYAHQDVPFEKLVEELAPERSLAHTPLFQAMLAFQGTPPDLAGAFDLPDLAAEPFPVEEGTAKFDLTLSLSEDGGLTGRLEHNRDLFDPATIDRFGSYLASLLAGAAQAPDTPLSELPFLSPAEREQVLETWAEVAPALPRRPVHELFAEQVARTPDAVALVTEEGSWTYSELREEAHVVAERLRAEGVGPETVVGLRVGRSAEFIVGMLGILEAGGAYLPLDPAYPKERLDWLIEDGGVGVILTGAPSPTLPRFAGEGAPTQILRFAQDDRWGTDRLDLILVTVSPKNDVPGAGALSREAGEGWGGGSFGDALAYLLHTSGSTGRPKGVLVPHGGLGNLAAAQIAAFDIHPGDRVLQFASPSFDASVSEIWTALLAGAELHLADPDRLLPGPGGLADLLAERRITCVTLPPPVLAAIPPDLPLPDLRTLVVAGESCPPDLARLWAGRVRLVNAYGPTEATVCATAGEILSEDLDAGRLSLGRPIPGVRVRVLGWDLETVPAGVVGEIALGGAGLARGYRGRPDLTAERFVPDPFGEPGERLYRTGDLGRWRRDGRLDFLGRRDAQVKIRGFRVEPGEAEAVLAAHPAVREAAVVARPAAAGGLELAAFVVPREAAASETSLLRAWLAERLPAHLVPAAFAVLPELPLTPNGKVDRKALAALAPERFAGGEAPRGFLEETLAALWAEVLNRPLESGGLSRHDSFFELGGHSLLATQVVSRIRTALGVELPLRALFETPTLAGLAEAVGRARGEAASPALPPLVAQSHEEPAPLSFAQGRLWFLDQLEPGSTAYNLPLAVRLEGPLDRSALAAALAGVVARHEALRTTFPTVGEDPVQEVAEEAAPALPFVDLAGLGERAASEAERLAQEDALLPFDLQNGPLFRPALLRVHAEDHRLLATMHHIVSDGWSMGVFVREVAELYAAARESRPARLASLPVQYRDYAVWQRQWLAGEALTEEVAFWREELAGLPPRLELPADRPRPAVRSFRGGRRTFHLPPETAAALRMTARAEGATLFMVLLAGFQALLGRRADQDDLAVGTPVAGRTRTEIEGLIGFFVNTLVLRGDLGGDPGLRTLLGRVRERALAAQAHQDLPFEKLVEEIAPQRNLDQTPLFQTMLVLQNTPGETPALAGLRLTAAMPETGTAKFDLLLALEETADGGLAGSLEYSRDLFDAPTVDRFLGHYAALLVGAVADPERRLSEILLLGEAERRQIQEWNATAKAYPAKTLPELFEEQVDRAPEVPALTFEGETWSYRRLDEATNRLARALRRRGVGTDVPVAVALERSLELEVALLAVLKAGGAYVPLDLSHPDERLAFLVADTQAPVVLTLGEHRGRFTGTASTVLALDDDRAAIEAEGPARLGLAIEEASAAYILFTSGSTGAPKGVVNHHAGIANRILWMQDAYKLDATDVVLQKTPYTFDVSVWEFFWPLIAGARLVMARPDGHRDPDYLLRVMEEEGVTTLHFVPSMLQVFLDGIAPEPGRAPSLRRTVTSGEVLPAELVRRFAERFPAADLHNLYGPTEAAVDVTAWTCSAAEETVPIGRPIANIEIRLLDRRGGPVPVGVPGELHIGGVGLARGYRNRPDLTAAAFVPHPGPAEPGLRLYRTGDLARYRPDGTLEYLGRIDNQVKIRGVRIEPGEIEAALARHPGIKEGAVGIHGAGGDKRLVAYVVASNGELSHEALRSYLRERLPEALVPAAFVVLPALPLSPNGKLDRKALARLGAGEIAPRKASAPPRTGAEMAVAAAWRQVLGLPEAQGVGVDDNFFDLGGHSLLLVKAHRILRERFPEVTVLDLFRYPTVGALAQFLSREKVEQVSLAESRERGENRGERAKRQRELRRQATTPDRGRRR